MSTSITSLRLCDYCTKFQDLDAVCERIKHHKSWADFCRSAHDGCHLCKAFVSCGKFKVRKGLPENFDTELDPADTLIEWMTVERSRMFKLQQKRLFFPPYKNVLNLWVEIFTEPNDPLASILPGRPILMDSGSDDSFKMMRKWIYNCRTNHPNCKTMPPRALPTRVVDVGSENPSVEPFVYVSDGLPGEWITLSHCWGGKLPLTTTSANLEQRCKAISFSELPATFYDAIILTRKLGFQYIWIDSLCIIQDSHQDWTSESTQMHQIYAGAFMNIAASPARNPEEGIFASGNRHRDLALPIISIPSHSSKHGVSGVLSIRPSMPGFPFTDTYNEPLHRRAWVLQESVLSARRLDFGSSELKWFCRSFSKREGFRDSPDKNIQGPDRAMSIGDGVDISSISPCMQTLDPVASGTSQTPLTWWYATFRRYIRRSITVHKDVLPAIAGIAEKIAKLSLCQYRAGMWLEDIHRGLLWQASWSVKRPSESSCPSWSWASTEFPWEDDRILALNTYEDGPRAEILDVDVVNAGGNVFGEVLSASLTIRSVCRTFDYWVGEHLPAYNNTRWIEDMKISHRGRDPKLFNDCATAALGKVICTLDERPMDVDAAHQDMLRQGVICLQIGKFGHYWGKKKCGETIFALVLRPTLQNPNEYRRVGIAEIPEEGGMADGWDTKTVTII